MHLSMRANRSAPAHQSYGDGTLTSIAGMSLIGSLRRSASAAPSRHTRLHRFCKRVAERYQEPDGFRKDVPSGMPTQLWYGTLGKAFPDCLGHWLPHRWRTIDTGACGLPGVGVQRRIGRNGARRVRAPSSFDDPSSDHGIRHGRPAMLHSPPPACIPKYVARLGDSSGYKNSFALSCLAEWQAGHDTSRMLLQRDGTVDAGGRDVASRSTEHYTAYRRTLCRTWLDGQRGTGAACRNSYRRPLPYGSWVNYTAPLHCQER